MGKQQGRTTPANHPGSDPAAAADMPGLLPVLAEMFQVARAYLLGSGSASSADAAIATNSKGQLTRAFDAEAERLALEVATRHLGSYRAFSEELGEVRMGAAAASGSDAPRWTLVLDPCDGSNNFRRGVRGVGFAVAALPGDDTPLDPARVEYALCGDVFSGSVYAAARGHGATLDGQPCHASSVRTLSHAMVSINLGRAGPPARGEWQTATAGATGATGAHDQSEPPPAEAIWRLIPQVSAVRRIGATVLDLCYVAQGAFDAYVDLRRRLTPENFMAPALIIREAGGIFSDGAGHPLGPVEFTAPYTAIAAGNATLHAEILRTLAS